MVVIIIMSYYYIMLWFIGVNLLKLNYLILYVVYCGVSILSTLVVAMIVVVVMLVHLLFLCKLPFFLAPMYTKTCG